MIAIERQKMSKIKVQVKVEKAELDKLELKDKDILLIKVPKNADAGMVRQETERLRRQIEGKAKEVLFLLVNDESYIAKLDETAMAKYGWYRKGECQCAKSCTTS